MTLKSIDKFSMIFPQFLGKCKNICHQFSLGGVRLSSQPSVCVSDGRLSGMTWYNEIARSKPNSFCRIIKTIVFICLLYL